MATGTGNLPHVGMSFSPFAILTAEEQNQLVANIESLATGSGIGDNSINFISLLSTIFSSQVQTYTNTGAGGGTGRYVNLGGIKLCWGNTGAFTTSSNTTHAISLPTGFFTTIQHHNMYIYGSSAAVNYVGVNATTTVVTIFVATAATNNVISWFVIGS